MSTERALAEADELELVTTGRVSGDPHTVRLRFAYDDGVIWLRTGERPSAPEASGIRRRTESDRTSDWLQNLEHDPRARVRIASAEVAAKYGAEWVGDWYLDAGRIPVKLRVLA